ncbi:isochorismate synthase MenF [Sporolactobacillus sp. THM19-2]|uniref:isochorismate synthase n=1 Tax=Sporolactobacillus sp. THM19-2 TaxID=2511171 RepID=UPI0010212581|nr:isochorismate synthase [Sporolactobacillus sp. THM19-2]RYL92170.1 isochorismate synthase [Sporolactobacillus sp. THM19-2]
MVSQVVDHAQVIRQPGNDDSRLVSLTRKIQSADPIAFYQSGEGMFQGKRFYWENPSGQLIMAGLGFVENIHITGEAQRFQRIRDNWSDIVSGVNRIGVTGIEATGPVLFGGFSFESEDNGMNLWQAFGNGCFYLPEFLLTVVEGCSYLTLNVCCPKSGSPDAVLTEKERLVADLLRKKASHSPSSGPFYPDHIEKQDMAAWSFMVNKALQNIMTGSIDKVVLARTVQLHYDQKPKSERVLNRLRKEQCGNYIFCQESGQDYFIGATPERLIRKEGDKLYSTCLAGSAARGKNAEEDRELGRKLLHDQKNRKEHQYVVSMIREVFQNLCSSVAIPEKPILLKNRDVQHLYTPACGRCRRDVSLFDLVSRLHPTPALGGLPRTAAVQWIRENETERRGLYGSPIGWCDAEGNGEFAVGIRSGLVKPKKAILYAGCGIVKDSVPETEYRETQMKFRPMMSGLGVSSFGTC